MNVLFKLVHNFSNHLLNPFCMDAPANFNQILQMLIALLNIDEIRT